MISFLANSIHTYVYGIKRSIDIMSLELLGLMGVCKVFLYWLRGTGCKFFLIYFPKNSIKWVYLNIKKYKFRKLTKTSKNS